MVNVLCKARHYNKIMPFAMNQRFVSNWQDARQADGQYSIKFGSPTFRIPRSSNARAINPATSSSLRQFQTKTLYQTCYLRCLAASNKHTAAAAAAFNDSTFPGMGMVMC